MGNSVSASNKLFGEFYTPEHVVKSFHGLAVDRLGDIYNDYVVWDPAWGTGNLTAGYDFKDLYCSTLRPLDIRRSRGINKGANKFVYDFLSDDIDNLVSIQNFITGDVKMPVCLNDKLKDGGRVLFFMNPPYAGTGNFGSHDRTSKTHKGRNKIQDIMAEDKMGVAIDNAYTQFMYRVLLMKKVYDLKDVSIAIICPPQFLTTETCRNFRDKFLGEFRFRGAKLIRASEFDGLSDAWGISLSVWDTGETPDKERFEHEVIEYDENKNEVIIENKVIYNLDNHVRANDWIREKVRNIEKVYMPTFTSGCRFKDTSVRGVDTAYGHMGSKANNIYHNDSEVVIVTGAYSDGCGIPITDKTFDDVIMYFTARKVYTREHSTWINDKDEYSMPLLDSENECVRRAINIIKHDGLVYSLFNGSFHATSMKDAPYNNGFEDCVKDVNNEFFWLTRDRVRGMLGDTAANTIERDTKVAKLIEMYINNDYLSEISIEVLNEANSIYKDMWDYRDEFNKVDGMYQVNNWDAGWYQIKQVLKYKEPKRFTEFNKLHRKLGNYIRLYIKESGMLL